MGNSMMTTHNINFEDMQLAINDQHSQNGQHSQYVKTLIINTLEAHQQSCLISGTLSIEMEIEVLNAHLKNNKDVQIIIYGMNSSDNTCIKKYEQLIKLGFYNVYIYGGGLFEWLLLQDIYGTELFPTTATKVDILKYKGRRILNMKMLEHY
jgi:hypothetical protein